jgi:hypothetical protein
LAQARRDGLAFREAWDGCVARAVRSSNPFQRREWMTALEATQAAWARSYRREPPTAKVAVLERLREL